MQNYQFDYSSYNKKINSHKKEGLTIITIVIILLMGVVVFVSKNFNRTDNFFFVEVGCFFKYADANSLAGEVQNKGGAGYVYYDGKYHVLTSFYLNKEDAESVCNNLVESYPNSKVFNLEIEKSRTNKKYSKQEQQFISKINNANKFLYEGLYSAINRNDTNTDNKKQLSLSLTNLYDTYAKESKDINNFFNSPTQLTTKNYVLDIADCSKNLKENLNEANYSSVLKYNLIKIVMLHCSFINSLYN